MAPKQVPVFVGTDAELGTTIDEIAQTLALPEGENTWNKIAAAIERLEAATKAGGYKRTTFLPLIMDKRISEPIANSVRSDRSALSGAATSFLGSLAPRLGDKFDVLIPYFMPPLLELLARTNKVLKGRATKTLSLVMAYCPIPGPLLKLLAPMQLSSKDSSVRSAVVQLTITLVQSVPDKLVYRLSRKPVPELVEQILTSGVADSANDVRGFAKVLFGLYEQRYTPRVESYANTLSPTKRQRLGLPKKGTYKPIVSDPVPCPSSPTPPAHHARPVHGPTHAFPPSSSSHRTPAPQPTPAPTFLSHTATLHANPSPERRPRTMSTHAPVPPPTVTQVAPKPAPRPASSAGYYNHNQRDDTMAQYRREMRAALGHAGHAGHAGPVPPPPTRSRTFSVSGPSRPASAMSTRNVRPTSPVVPPPSVHPALQEGARRYEPAPPQVSSQHYGGESSSQVAHYGAQPSTEPHAARTDLGTRSTWSNVPSLAPSGVDGTNDNDSIAHTTHAAPVPMQGTGHVPGQSMGTSEPFRPRLRAVRVAVPIAPSAPVHHTPHAEPFRARRVPTVEHKVGTTPARPRRAAAARTPSHTIHLPQHRLHGRNEGQDAHTAPIVLSSAVHEPQGGNGGQGTQPESSDDLFDISMPLLPRIDSPSSAPTGTDTGTGTGTGMENKVHEQHVEHEQPGCQEERQVHIAPIELPSGTVEGQHEVRSQEVESEDKPEVKPDVKSEVKPAEQGTTEPASNDVTPVASQAPPSSTQEAFPPQDDLPKATDDTSKPETNVAPEPAEPTAALAPAPTQFISVQPATAATEPAPTPATPRARSHPAPFRPNTTNLSTAARRRAPPAPSAPPSTASSAPSSSQSTTTTKSQPARPASHIAKAAPSTTQTRSATTRAASATRPTSRLAQSSAAARPAPRKAPAKVTKPPAKAPLKPVPKVTRPTPEPKKKVSSTTARTAAPLAVRRTGLTSATGLGPAARRRVGATQPVKDKEGADAATAPKIKSASASRLTAPTAASRARAASIRARAPTTQSGSGLASGMGATGPTATTTSRPPTKRGVTNPMGPATSTASTKDATTTTASGVPLRTARAAPRPIFGPTPSHGNGTRSTYRRAPEVSVLKGSVPAAPSSKSARTAQAPALVPEPATPAPTEPQSESKDPAEEVQGQAPPQPQPQEHEQVHEQVQGEVQDQAQAQAQGPAESQEQQGTDDHEGAQGEPPIPESVHDPTGGQQSDAQVEVAQSQETASVETTAHPEPVAEVPQQDAVAGTEGPVGQGRPTVEPLVEAQGEPQVENQPKPQAEPQVEAQVEAQAKPQEEQVNQLSVTVEEPNETRPQKDEVLTEPPPTVPNEPSYGIEVKPQPPSPLPNPEPSSVPTQDDLPLRPLDQALTAPTMDAAPAPVPAKVPAPRTVSGQKRSADEAELPGSPERRERNQEGNTGVKRRSLEASSDAQQDGDEDQSMAEADGTVVLVSSSSHDSMPVSEEAATPVDPQHDELASLAQQPDTQVPSFPAPAPTTDADVSHQSVCLDQLESRVTPARRVTRSTIAAQLGSQPQVSSSPAARPTADADTSHQTMCLDQMEARVTPARPVTRSVQSTPIPVTSPVHDVEDDLPNHSVVQQPGGPTSNEHGGQGSSSPGSAPVLTDKSLNTPAQPRSNQSPLKTPTSTSRKSTRLAPRASLLRSATRNAASSSPAALANAAPPSLAGTPDASMSISRSMDDEVDESENDEETIILVGGFR